MPYRSTKTYGHEQGLSACFRQWRAESHCRLLHGYSLAFHFVFEADELDDRNWVVDFGGLKPLKIALERYFDHKTLVARDDPFVEKLSQLHTYGIAEIIVLEKVGCEAFAELGWNLARNCVPPRIRVVSCEVREHGANSAIYLG